MRRVLVIGCSGSGKSTFARKVGSKLNLPVIHLDQLYWRPGWRPAPRVEFEAAVAEAAARESWVMDGNSPSTFHLRMPRVDTLVWFRRSRYLCFWRVAKRITGSYGRVREDMAAGCPEHIDLEFLKYIWNFERMYTARIEQAISSFNMADRLTVVRKDSDAEAFLRSLPRA